MNSISLLDSVLTRSLTTSRAPSGTTTPSHGDVSSSSKGHLNRRASDYSLNSGREREKRKVAASLGLTSLDGDETSHASRSRKPSRKGLGRANMENEHQRDSQMLLRHPKSHSEDQASKRLKRTESTPNSLRSSSANGGWNSLWGLGGFIENSVSYDSYARRGSLGSDAVSKQADRKPDSLTSPRRASTGDVDAAEPEVALHALLSERERDDVVDFEGYDPDDDVGQILPQTPPSTPHPPSSSISNTYVKQPPSQHESHLATGSKLSSLLFGALNPLTDDYFGPQPSSRPSIRRRRSSDMSSRSSSEKRSPRSSASQKGKKSEKYATSHEKSDSISSSSEAHSSLKEKNSETIPNEPPPPYSDAKGNRASSLLLPPPNVSRSPPEKGDRKPRRRFTLSRGAKTALDILKRVFLLILLSPYHILQYGKAIYRRKGVRVSAAQNPNTATHNNGTPGKSTKAFHAPSQMERPLAARHKAGVRHGQQLPQGISLEDSQQQFDSDQEEIVTEDQAEAQATRRAQLEPQPLAEPHETRQALASRLLPNPNPVDPLLAHDRHAGKLTEKESKQREEQQHQRREKQARIRQANRGPTSSLVHHTPKVLVLDLDETLIHSTSRSPTWSALADKSKSGMAVTAGGSLLGLEGLGGVLGLRGQVGVRPHQVEVILDGRSIIYHVYKRPHVETFLRQVAAWYHVVVFTASVQEYADPVIDWLDQGRGLISGRLFRESCTFRNGSYLKNLSNVDADLSRICLVDNSPASYLINQGKSFRKLFLHLLMCSSIANGIPIEGWTHDPNDEALLDLLPVLDSLRFAGDVRHILGIRGFSH